MQKVGSDYLGLGRVMGYWDSTWPLSRTGTSTFPFNTMLSIMIKHGLYMAVSLGVGIARFIPRTAPAAAGRAAAQHMTQEHHPLSDANITNKPGVPTASEEPPDPTDRVRHHCLPLHAATCKRAPTIITSHTAAALSLTLPLPMAAEP